MILVSRPRVSVMVCTAERLHCYLSSVQPAVIFLTFLRYRILCVTIILCFTCLEGPWYSCESTLVQKQICPFTTPMQPQRALQERSLLRKTQTICVLHYSPCGYAHRVFGATHSSQILNYVSVARPLNLHIKQQDSLSWFSGVLLTCERSILPFPCSPLYPITLSGCVRHNDSANTNASCWQVEQAFAMLNIVCPFIYLAQVQIWLQTVPLSL